MTQQDEPPQPRETVRGYWAGPQLSPYEVLSLKSFVASGARVMLYSPDPGLRVPDGVELVDVNELVADPVHVFIYDDGDPCLSIHSDLFRYLAVHRYGGWYFDLDIVFVGKSLPKDKVYIGRENGSLINGAVMKFPAAAPFLTTAINETRRLLPQSGRLDVGPDLVTRLVDEFALDHVVKPRSSVYEIRTTEVVAMFDPDERGDLDARVRGSDFVHLWNEIWRRTRIPKSYGPPEGSFLDGLFKRHGIEFRPEARLSLKALQTWMHERNLLAWQQTVPYQPPPPRAKCNPSEERGPATAPQTVRTFWHGEWIRPYQQMCLKSFTDRGHRVEVFSFGDKLKLPGSLIPRDAAEIIDPDSILRYLPEQEQFAINANLFRLALLNKLGGWWIDPDVVLLGADLPAGDVFIGGPSASGRISTAAIKLPPGHPLTVEALTRAAGYAEKVPDWEFTGAPLLAECVDALQLSDSLQPASLTSPLSWLEAAALFDPAQRDDVARLCKDAAFLDLHTDVWLRAGIPAYLGPPEGSFLDLLMQRYDIGFQFATPMEFSDVKRWLGHMYAFDRARRAQTPDGGE